MEGSPGQTVRLLGPWDSRRAHRARSLKFWVPPHPAPPPPPHPLLHPTPHPPPPDPAKLRTLRPESVRTFAQTESPCFPAPHSQGVCPLREKDRHKLPHDGHNIYYDTSLVASTHGTVYALSGEVDVVIRNSAHLPPTVCWHTSTTQPQTLHLFSCGLAGLSRRLLNLGFGGVGV